MLKPFVRRSMDRVAGAALNRRLADGTDEVRFAIGELRSSQARQAPPPRSLRDTEFKVFSQWGEDGVIQYLTQVLSPPETFVEIGVSDYRESNTRFLAMKDNWRGAIFNAGTAHVDFLRTSELGWRFSIDAVSAFVTRDNVNGLISGTGIAGEIGLLSIDIDGIDYWLWDAIDGVDPWIVVIEFNSVFGADQAVTVPYDAGFTASGAHFSGQYFGASLAALHALGKSKGYRLVGVTRQGVNAFFVRDDVAGELWDLSPAEAYVHSRFRTARNADGTLAYAGDDHATLLASMAHLPLVPVGDREPGAREAGGERRTIGELYPG